MYIKKIIKEYDALKGFNLSFKKRIRSVQHCYKSRSGRGYKLLAPLWYIILIVGFYLIFKYFTSPEFQIKVNKAFGKLPKFNKKPIGNELLIECIDFRIEFLEKEAILNKNYLNCKSDIIELEQIKSKIKLRYYRF